MAFGFGMARRPAWTPARADLDRDHDLDLPTTC
jgi:hypothetical protein